ncbi:MAG TPA: M14 metallopeptidase family protein, partial [Flavisolibacter sp.]|nr:M14 metallopeptidase family protein [Flavisolibacter sp.]
MYKRVIGSVLALMLHGLALAQVQSPEQFLGYKLGSRYTPHWRIVEYYKHLANAAPSQVKLQEYGKTNEGRPLMVAIVSSAENMGRLEAIRNNNLGLAMMVGQGSTKNAPVIVWLSYNVHGNETSSSEAGMATIWSLLDPANGQSRQWLQNSVVVIDPCMNPDGRDRYVNWFQSVAGTRYNPALEAREHREPWPGGRTNHYNFDLNRDWAWQTQVESQQRLKLYHQWMPQVHVDFHEQGVNQPYYFAPAAKPYHEIITPFQREFQVAIGRNHAKYFDQKGWLYFTREVFDLLYPSYGDTYPIFNGAIGMTYEQGGGPAGGAAALTDEGDTLTLLDRINHHHTTSLSTIELASQQSAALLDAFARYFSMAASTGFGDYRSYVIKQNANDGQRIAALLDLLQKNHISFSAGKEGSYRGLSYDSGKEESFRLETGDIVIPGAQAKGALVRVLFEPNTQVEDSNTYDITAWALPYAYGLKAYAVKQAIAPSSGSIKAFNPNGAAAAETYGYVIPWTGLNSVRLTGHLLQKGIKLRLSEQPFELGGRTFERGSIIILRTSNQYYPGLWNEVREVANQYQVAITPVNTGLVEKGYDFGSEKVRPLRQRRVAMLTGEGVNSNAAG